MLVNGYGGLVVSDPRKGLSEHFGDLAQLMGLAGVGFGGLPDDFRSYILSQRPENPGETEALLNNDDGLRKVPDFANRWMVAVGLSQQVDQIRGDPASSSLNSKESGLANNLLGALVRARNYYPWGSVWGRTQSNQAGLSAALSALDTGLSQYISQVQAGLDAARAAIDAREQAKAKAAAEAAEADRQRQLAAQAAAAAAAAADAAKQAQSQQVRAEASTAALVAQQKEVVAQLDFDKLVRKAQAPKIFGIPLVVAVPVMLAGTVGVVMVVMRKKSGAAMGGYKRRRRKVRRSRRRARRR